MFRRIPPLLMKRALWVALPVSVVALTVLLVVFRRMDEPGIRFRLSNYGAVGFVSLDEPKIARLYHLDLSSFQFPADSPLAVDKGRVYLRLPVHGQQVLVGSDLTLPNDCTPSPDLERLLCGVPRFPEGYAVSPGREEIAEALGGFLYGHRLFFIITPGFSQIYIIPEGDCLECEFTYKTDCQWATVSRIYCTTGYGNVWRGVALFDLNSRSYIDLPHEGGEIWPNTSFTKGYIYWQNHSAPNILEVYTLDQTLVFAGATEDWIADEGTVASVGYCGMSLCVHELEFDNNGLRTSREAVLLDLSTGVTTDRTEMTLVELLATYWWPEGYSTSSIVAMPDEYLVSGYGKVYILSKATLQVMRVLEYPEAHISPSEPNRIALYKHAALLVTGSTDYDFEVESEATAYDLSKCQARLEDSCKLQIWNSVKRPEADDPFFYDVRRHIYYLPANQPDLILSVDEDAGLLTIYNLKNWTEYSFELAGVPELVTTSTDGRFLLVATTPDHETLLRDAQYHLFDLRTMRPDPRELVVGKNLFLVWGHT